MLNSIKKITLASLVSATMLCCNYVGVYTPIPINRELKTVTYSLSATHKIYYLYDNITDSYPPREFVACLRGEIRESDVYVDDVRLPEILYADEGRAVWRGCKTEEDEFVGIIHSHVFSVTEDNCHLSIVDWQTFLENPKNSISALSCYGKKIRTYIRPSEKEVTRILKEIKEFNDTNDLQPDTIGRTTR